MKRLCFAAVIYVVLLECSAFEAVSKTAGGGVTSCKPAIAVFIEDMT